MGGELIPIRFTHPDLCREWSDRNDAITPDMVSAGSHDKVWWKGSCGHEWMAAVNNRALSHTGCPYCSSRKLLIGFNDLQTKNPELAREWSERNLPLTPDRVMPFSRKKLWWKCPQGHEWQATANSRSRGSKCTVCRNRLIIPGLNDLPARYPELMKEWSGKNGSLKPDQMLAKDAAQSVWWTCGKCGRDYHRTIAGKLADRTGCPWCSGRLLERGFNDLATTHPELAAEWDKERNEEVSPRDVTRISRRYVWWNCPNGHSWGCRLAERTLEGKACVICRAERRAVLPVWLTAVTARKLRTPVVPLAKAGSTLTFDLLLPELKLAADIGCVSEEGRRQKAEKKMAAEEAGYHYTALPVNSSLSIQKESVIQAFRECGIEIGWDLSNDAAALENAFDRIRGEFKNKSGKDINEMDDELKKLLLKVILMEEATQAGQNVAPAKPARKKRAPEPERGIDYDPNEVTKPARDPRIKEMVMEDLQKVQTEMYATHVNNLKELKVVPIWAKYALTVSEASQYFHIGTKKLKEIIRKDKYADYLIWNGGRVFIKRKLFEEYLNREVQI